MIELSDEIVEEAAIGDELDKESGESCVVVGGVEVPLLEITAALVFGDVAAINAASPPSMDCGLAAEGDEGVCEEGELLAHEFSGSD